MERVANCLVSLFLPVTCLCCRVGGSSSRGDGTRYSPYPTAKRSSAAASSTDSSGAAVGFVESLPVAPEGTDPLNVYVVDLPLSFTKEEFQALYEPFGSLVTSTVLTDPTSGQSRGIGFARYSNTDNAARALKETQGMMLPGATKPLLVRFARDSSRKHEEQTNSTAQRLHSHSQYQPLQQPMHPQPVAYSSTYTQPYPYAPSYAAGPSYYPHYPQQLPSPAHRALPAPPPPPLPQPPSSVSAPPSSAASALPARPSSTYSAAPNAPLAAPAAADGSSAVSTAAYQQAWAAYYAQLGYPGYYTGYQYPAVSYTTPPYTYPSAAPPAAATSSSAVSATPSPAKGAGANSDSSATHSASPTSTEQSSSASTASSPAAPTATASSWQSATNG